MVAVSQGIKRADFSEIGVGRAVTITLLRCLPGSDQRAAKRLCDLEGAIVYKLYGDADFAVVCEFPDQPERLQLSEDLGLSHLRTITAFSWTGLDGLEVAGLRKYPLAGFCFLKLNPDWLAAHGVEGERRVLRAISEYIRSHTKVGAAISGTTGWFEAVLLVSGQTASDILRFANQLRRVVVVIERQQGRTTRMTPCFQTTETIPGAALTQGVVPRRLKLGRGVKIQLRARCYSWADSRVRKELSEHMGTPEAVAGTDDFLVADVRPRTLSSYADALWAFRDRARGLLYSTSTSFILTGDGRQPTGETVDVQPPTPISVGLPDRNLRNLSKRNPTLHQTLRDTYSLLNDIMFDCRKSAAVTDLIPFAEEVLETYITSKARSKKLIQELDIYLGECLGLLRWGVQQRYLGTDACGWDIGIAAAAGGSQGVHRVLAALSLVPALVLRGVGARWTGFVTCGLTDDYKRFSGGVLNAGSHSIARPDTYFVIFHEIGHEYGSQIDVAHHPHIRQALMSQGMYTEDSIREVTEVYAEVFACLFGYGGDFTEAVTHTWRYLASLDKVRANLSRYFLRGLMVYIFMLEELGDKYITDEAGIRSIGVDLRRRLRAVLPAGVSISDRALDSACSDALRLRTVLDVIRDLMPTQRMSRPASNDDYTPFQEGRILMRLDDPVQFLKDVPRFCPKPTFRQSVAIILSLWNASMRHQQGN